MLSWLAAGRPQLGARLRGWALPARQSPVGVVAGMLGYMYKPSHTGSWRQLAAAPPSLPPVPVRRAACKPCRCKRAQPLPVFTSTTCLVPPSNTCIAQAAQAARFLCQPDGLALPPLLIFLWPLPRRTRALVSCCMATSSPHAAPLGRWAARGPRLLHTPTLIHTPKTPLLLCTPGPYSPT